MRQRLAGQEHIVWSDRLALSFEERAHSGGFASSVGVEWHFPDG